MGISGAGAFPPGTSGTIGGNVLPGQYDPPGVPPTADYQTAVTAPAAPVVAQVPGQAQIDATGFNSVVATAGNVGSVQTLQGGGWRYLNREIWAKDTRADPDQVTDQRPGDLQVTRESDHQELKAWNAASRPVGHDLQPRPDQCRHRGPEPVRGHGGSGRWWRHRCGGVCNACLTLVAMSTAGDLSLTSHYWTYIGDPNSCGDINHAEHWRGP